MFSLTWLVLCSAAGSALAQNKPIPTTTFNVVRGNVGTFLQCSGPILDSNADAAGATIGLCLQDCGFPTNGQAKGSVPNCIQGFGANCNARVNNNNAPQNGVCQAQRTVAGVCCEGTVALRPPPGGDAPTPPAGSSGDPWVEGYLGQHFYIEGPNAWYAVISDSRVQLNLWMQTFDDQLKQTYWTKASLQHFSADGLVQQSFLLEIVDHTAESVSCAAIGAASPCIGNGGVLLTVNGEKHTAPGEFETGPGFFAAAANLPSACKHYTKTFQALHPKESRRALAAKGIAEFATSRETFGKAECLAWIAEESEMPAGIFGAEGENSLFLLTTPSLTVALEQYKYTEAGFQYYRFDVSAVDFIVTDMSEPQGIVAETLRPRLDAAGKVLMSGQVLKAPTSDYIVQTAVGRDFRAKSVAEFSVDFA